MGLEELESKIAAAGGKVIIILWSLPLRPTRGATVAALTRPEGP